MTISYIAIKLGRNVFKVRRQPDQTYLAATFDKLRLVGYNSGGGSFDFFQWIIRDHTDRFVYIVNRKYKYLVYEATKPRLKVII